MSKNCPGCGAPMEYDPGFDALVCTSCGSIVDPKTLPDADSFYYEDDSPEEPQDIRDTLSEFEELTGEMYDCHVYKCSQCGGEVTVSGTEISTRCVYCGSTAVVFSRISKENRPDRIVPFSITKEEAVSLVEEKLLSGRFVSPQNGPKRYLVYGPKRDQRTDGLYGPMGQMAYMSDSLVKGSETVKAICQPLQPNMHYDRFRLFADTSVHYTTSRDTMFLSGRGGVYGLSQESKTGIIVDNIPMRGCMGIVFTKMDSAQLSTFYSEENVRLIIMQFGGNAIPSNKNPGTIQAIVKGLRQQVQYLRRCAPEASILFIGPSDMLTQIDGEWTTYPMVPYMDKLLRKMALEENIAYFSLYRWMGGSGSMMKWQEVGLAGSDGVHFTRAGARKAGKAVAEWMMEGNE